MKILQKRLSFKFWQHDFKRKDFSIVNEEDISYFKSILPTPAIIDDPESI